MPLTDESTRGDPSTLSPSGRYRAVKQLGLVALCAAWILLGLFGHDPWKPDDAISFGIAYDMLEHGYWVAPRLAGTPVPDRPPLLYALAAATAAAFRDLLPLYDGARIAVGAVVGATLWLLSLAARELYGRAFGWLAVLLFIGSIGLWDRGHQLSLDMGVLPWDALALYALAIVLRRPLAGGGLLGLAIGAAFLFRGALGASLIALTALLLPVFAGWRTRRYALALGLAAAIAVPLLVVWPLALHIHAPELFGEWLEAQSLTRFFGLAPGSPAVEPFYYLKNLTWFAWPALPLALWTLWVRGRAYNATLASPGVELPVTMLCVLLLVLSAAADSRTGLALPMLLPLALLGAAEVDTLKRGYSGALDWFGILTFGLIGIVLWGLWIESLRSGMPVAVARIFRDTQPGFQPPWELIPLVASILLTLLWLILVRPARRSNRRAVLNWAAGMTLAWGLFATIWLPYVDSRRSYRPVMESLAAHMPAHICVAGRNLGEPQRALLEYFAHIVTVRDDLPEADRCDALLSQVGGNESAEPPDPSWEKVWEGHRRGDDTERFVLFRRPSVRPAAS